MDSNGDGLDLTEYVGTLAKNDDSDSAGKGDRQHASFLRLSTKQGIKGIPYGGIYGIDQAEDCTEFRLTFHAMILWDGERRDRHFVATIRGQRLEPIVHQVCVACRKTIHPSGPVSGDKPQVDSIELEPFDPDGE